MFPLKKRRKSYTIKMISIGKEELDMRVIAGKARRLPLVSPEGRGTRPTTDRIKETLFNILQDDIPGCRFNLDEFNDEFQHFLKVTKDFCY